MYRLYPGDVVRIKGSIENEIEYTVERVDGIKKRAFIRMKSFPDQKIWADLDTLEMVDARLRALPCTNSKIHGNVVGDTSPIFTASTTGGQKESKGKTPMQYLPLDLCEGAAKVLAKNAKENGGKYDADNFRKGVGTSVAVGSILRHLTKIQEAIRNGDKENTDEESGEPHVSHLLADVLILIAAMKVEGFKV